MLRLSYLPPLFHKRPFCGFSERQGLCASVQVAALSPDPTETDQTHRGLRAGLPLQQGGRHRKTPRLQRQQR